VTALERGDIARVGQLLDEAHASARDDYRISTPELDLLAAAARQVEGVAGARLTGAGWGGCVIALVPEAQIDECTRHVKRVYNAQTGRKAAVFPCQAGSGAQMVAVAEV